MADTPRRVRFRVFLADYLVYVMLVALAVTAVGGYLTVTAYGEPETRVQTSQATTWEVSGSFTHSATVVNDTAVYDVGDRLQDRSVYFREITPRLDGAFLYRYTARESANLTAETTLSLVFRSAGDSASGNVTEYWRLASDLGGDRTALAPGDRVRVPFSINVSAATQRLDAIDSQFGTTPGQKELFVVADVALAGTRNGTPVDETRTYRLPVTLDGSVYSVEGTGPVVDSGRRTVRQTTPVDPAPLRAFGGPLLVVLGLAAVLCCAGVRYRGVDEVSDAEREWLAYHTVRTEYDDWITRAALPATERPESAVAVESLEGLVDIAIDVDSRVLSESGGEAFVVFDDDRAYRYDPPQLPGSTDGVLAEPDPATDESSAPADDAESTEGPAVEGVLDGTDEQ